MNQDIDNLFVNKDKELMYAFDKLLSYIIDWEDVSVSATKNCIVFVNTQTFLVVKPMKKVLNIKFYLNEPKEIPPVFKVAKYNGREEHHVRVSTLEEINTPLVDMIKSSYNLFRNKTVL
jgi:hypothetical protein